LPKLWAIKYRVVFFVKHGVYYGHHLFHRC